MDEFAEHRRIARDEFCYAPSRLKLISDEKEGAPVAYIDRMQIVVNDIYIERAEKVSPRFALEYFRAILRHEHRHLYADGAPITVRNLINFQKMLKEIFKDKDFVAVPIIANIIFDVIVDVANLDLLDDRIDITARVVYKDFTDVDVSNSGTAFLIAFREEAMGMPFSGLELHENVREAAVQSVAVCRQRDKISLEDQVRKIGEILLELFIKNPPPPSGGGGGGGGKSMQEKLKDLADALEKAMEKELKDPRRSPTIEDMSSDPTQGKLDQVNFDDRDEVIIIGQQLGIKQERMEYYRLRQKARKNLNFRVRATGKHLMNSFAAGHSNWRLQDQVKQMDVQATLRRHGINIPTVTTKKKFMVTGPGMPQEGAFPELYPVIDASGSMRTDQHDAELALFSMIEAAKRHGVRCGFSLFADRSRDFRPTYDYESLFRAAYDEFDSVGGGNSCSGLDQLVGKVKRGSLVVYITDFCLMGNDQKKALQSIAALRSQGVQVVFVVMFTKQSVGSIDMPYVFCKRVEDLSEVLLSTVDG